MGHLVFVLGTEVQLFQSRKGTTSFRKAVGVSSYPTLLLTDGVFAVELVSAEMAVPGRPRTARLGGERMGKYDTKSLRSD